ncbi:hypothetical protein [Enterococcus sp. AZ163]|uniref:hypothetical protein n=1 Tax=Enterococcus sp. AZ163 TaxID=2774638 RepID=UPI003D2A0C5F
MNKQDKLWEQQDKLLGDIEFVLNAYQEEMPIYSVVTEDYPAIEGFIGNSILETGDGKPGHLMQGENGETIFVQFFSDDKKVYTYIKDGLITRYEFLVLDYEIDTPIKKLKYVAKKVDELKKVQQELEALETAENEVDQIDY